MAGGREDLVDALVHAYAKDPVPNLLPRILAETNVALTGLIQGHATVLRSQAAAHWTKRAHGAHLIWEILMDRE